MAAWRYGFNLLVLKTSTLEDKIRISAQPCNILYLLDNKHFLFNEHPLFEPVRTSYFKNLKSPQNFLKKNPKQTWTSPGKIL